MTIKLNMLPVMALQRAQIYTHIDRNFKQHRTHMYHQYQTNNNNNIHIYVCVSQVHVRTERAEIVEIPNSVNKNDGVKNKAKYYFSLL